MAKHSGVSSESTNCWRVAVVNPFSRNHQTLQRTNEMRRQNKQGQTSLKFGFTLALALPQT